MMKEVLRSAETGILAEIGLIAFILAFSLVVIRVFLYTKKEVQDARNMPLQDDLEIKTTPPKNGSYSV